MGPTNTVSDWPPHILGLQARKFWNTLGPRYPEIMAGWAPNEKVALEVAAGACYGGARAMASMKHVGLNVAADPFMTLSYTGVNGGLVIVVCDDPEMHSSQNEQDTRNYAKFGKSPCLEPSDSQEAKDLVGEALKLANISILPCFLSSSTRVSRIPCRWWRPLKIGWKAQRDWA